MNVRPKLKEQILNEIFKVLDREKVCVVLFGSSALDKGSPYSDIDIGLFYTEGIDDETFLNLKNNLNYWVDTARIIDLVDFQRVDLDFLEFALKGAVIWHVGKEFLKNLLKQKKPLENLKR